MQDSLAGRSRHWRQSGSPGWHFGSSQCYADGALAESISSSLRLPTAKPIFGRGIETVCSILTKQANSKAAICDDRSWGHDLDFETAHGSGFVYFGT
jgi:hypothetical protein